MTIRKQDISLPSPDGEGSGVRLSRVVRLLGSEATERLASLRVIIFGVGGVGSWCAESLIRTGVRRLTIVDGDTVNESNINRQAMAVYSTLGQPKVEAMRQRLLDINPGAEITALYNIYKEETAPDFRLEDYDVIVDAIDSLSSKAQLILHATSLPTKPLFVSSMGAALKLDATKIQVAEFWNVKGCPLARALRTKFKKQKTFPKRKFLCVFSEELHKNSAECRVQSAELAAHDANSAQTNSALCTLHSALFNGSLVHITATFGFTLASIIVNKTLNIVD